MGGSTAKEKGVRSSLLKKVHSSVLSCPEVLAPLAQIMYYNYKHRIQTIRIMVLEL